MNRSFRHRLMLHVGVVLSVWLGLIAIGLWVGTRQMLREHREGELALEARRIVEAITAGGRFQPTHKNWEELHHQHAEPRVHPYFVQVFDAQGQLVQQSDNLVHLALLPATPPTTQPEFLWTVSQPPMVMHHADIVVRDQRVGTLRIASFDGGVGARMRLLAWVIPIVYLALVLTLMGFLFLAARRVVEPLEQITAHLKRPHLSPTPIALPPHADHETVTLARALEEAIERKETAIEQMRDFSHHAAHELKTPLTAVLGTLDVALRRDRSPEAYRELLEVVRQDVRHLVHLVQALLHLSRLDRTSEPPTQTQSLQTLVEESLHDVGLRLADVKLHAEGSVEGPLVWVREMLSILLDNAAKYGGNKGLVVEATVSSSTLSVYVRDAGPGFAPDVLSNADARFARASNVQHIPGSGLGLSIVRKVSERLGGALAWGNAPEGGAWVAVYLPVTPRPGNVYRLKATDTAIPPTDA